MISRRSFIGGLAVLLASGCGTGRTEYSEPMTEIGQVYDVAFVPSGHGRDTAIGFNSGKGGGMTVTPVNVNIPERYAIVFKCQHGKFVIDGSKAKALYHRLDRGDDVKIIYREVIEVAPDDKGKETRTVVDLDFIDAEKLPKQAELASDSK